MSNSDIIMAVVTFNQRQRGARFFSFSFCYCLFFWSVCRKMKRIEKKGGSGLGCILQFIKVDCYIIEAVIVYLLIAHLSESLMIFQVKEIIFLMVFFHFGGNFAKKNNNFFVLQQKTIKTNFHFKISNWNIDILWIEQKLIVYCILLFFFCMILDI